MKKFLTILLGLCVIAIILTIFCQKTFPANTEKVNPQIEQAQIQLELSKIQLALINIKIEKLKAETKLEKEYDKVFNRQEAERKAQAEKSAYTNTDFQTDVVAVFTMVAFVMLTLQWQADR